MRLSRFSIKVLLLAIIPALAVLLSFLLILANIKSDLNQHLSQQTKTSLENLYSTNLTRRSQDLTTIVTNKLNNVAHELSIISNYAQLLIDAQDRLLPVIEQAKSNPLLTNPLIYNEQQNWANSKSEHMNTVVALWGYLLDDNGQPKPDVQRYIDRLSLMNPLMESAAQSGSDKSWVYVAGPKEMPLVYASPWAEIPAIFDQKYPGHNSENWWDFFFPGLIESWQSWTPNERRDTSKQLTLTPIYDDAAGQGLMVTFFQPLWTPDRRYNYGAAAIDYNIAQLINMIREEAVGDNGFAFLVLDNGETIGVDSQQANLLGLVNTKDFSDGVRTHDFNIFNSRFFDIKGIRLPAKNNAVELVELTLDNQDYLLSLQQVTSFNRWQGNVIEDRRYYVAMLVPKSEVYAIHAGLAATLRSKIDNSGFQLVIVSLIVSFLVFFIAATFALRHTHQINLLTIGASRLAKGDFTHKIPEIGRGEVTQLAATVNDLASELDAMYKQQEAHKLTLQAEVEVRTEQLNIARLEAEHANTAKSQFLANMSHEIRTPLTTVLGYADAILNGDIAQKDAIKAVSSIQKSGNHLLLLINDLLDLSKIEAEQVELKQAEFEVALLVSELIEYGESRAAANNISFQCLVVYPISKTYVSDVTRIKQVLLNLLSNAFKFTEKGQVLLTVRESEDKLCFSVADSGRGIAEAHLSRIFNPFEQTSLDIAQQYGGTGLGLSISKMLVTLFGGEMNVRSELGEGTEFSFYIPLIHSDEKLTCKEELEQVVVKTSQRQDPNLHQLVGKVLLAEDHYYNSELVATLLKKLGLNVSQVFDGQSAVEKALEDDFDLILMDIQMPIMNGCEALKMLRSAGVDTPVVALTANVLSHEVDHYHQLGFDGCLGKPLEREKFIKLVAQIMGEFPVVDNDNVFDNTQFLALQSKFRTSLKKEYDELMNLIESQNWQQVSKLCHRIKGAAAMFAMTELAAHFARAEQILNSTYLDAERDEVILIAVNTLQRELGDG